MSEEAKKEAKKYNLDGLLHEKTSNVVRTIASAPLICRLGNEENASQEAKETANTVIREAWAEAAVEAVQWKMALGAGYVTIGVASAVAASFSGSMMNIAVVELVAFGVSICLSHVFFHESKNLSRSQYDSNNIFKPDPNAWQNEEVYRLAKKKVGEKVLIMQNL